MQLSFKEPSSELARRFHHFQGVWLRSGTVHGAPFYRQSGNLINWLGRFQPLDAYGPAGWAVSDPFEAGTVQVGHAPDGHAHFFLGGSARCPRFLDRVYYKNADGQFIEDDGILISCVQK